MLDEPVLKAFAEWGHKRSFPPKHTIIHAGDEPASLYLILEGSVSILLEGDDGREIVLAYLGPGEFFGEMCLFPAQRLRTAAVRTRAATLTAEIGYERLIEFERQHPRIMFQLAGQLAARLRDTTRRLGDLTFVDVAGRMARTLLELVKEPDAQTHAGGTLIRSSRQELARLVGCSREMAGRVLKKLEEDGIIQCRGRSILVFGQHRA